MPVLTATPEGARKALQALVVDNKDLDQLELLLSDFNIFEAIGTVGRELSHSSFLAYLLDPNRSHGLGDYFLKALFKRSLAGPMVKGATALDIDVADFSDATVEREKWNIDVLIYSEGSRIALAIENKIESSEHSDQLNRYRITLDREFPGYTKALLYLSPDGYAASDSENWQSLSYTTLVDVLRTVRLARQNTLGDAVAIAIEHYETMVGRHVVTDSDIARLCQKIYRQHREALDLIYEHRPDVQTTLQGVVEEVIRSQQGYKLKHGTKSSIKFLPSSWDVELRPLYFEVTNGSESMRLKLMVGPIEQHDKSSVSLRDFIVSYAQQHRMELPNAGITPGQRVTTIMSVELTKKNDYVDVDTLPEKARSVLQDAFTRTIPEVSALMARLLSQLRLA